MDKKRIEIILTGIFVVIFIFVWINAIKTIKKKSKSKPSFSQPAAFMVNDKAVEAKKVTTEVFPKTNDERGSDDDVSWTRCSFSGKFYTTQDSASELELMGILWDEVDPQAIINKEIFRCEDTIGKYRIVDIRKNKVILNDGEKNLELKLEQY